MAKVLLAKHDAVEAGVLLLFIALVLGGITGSKNVSAAVSDLKLTTTTDKQNYSIGEPVNITLLLNNTGVSSVTLHFPSTCQAYFRVENGSGAVIFDLSNATMCAQVPTQRSLAPSEVFRYIFRWSQTNETGNPIVLRGSYTVRGWIASSESVPPATTTINISTALGTVSGYSQIMTILVAVSLTSSLLLKSRRPQIP